MNTGGPAFPVPDSHHANGQVQYGANGMSLLDWFAGRETLSDFDHPEEQMPVNGAVELAGPQPDGGKGWNAHLMWNAEWRAKMKYMRATAMLAEKARREADHSGGSNKMVQDHFRDAAKMTKLEARNRELVEALSAMEMWVPTHCENQVVAAARAVLAKAKETKP